MKRHAEDVSGKIHTLVNLAHHSKSKGRELQFQTYMGQLKSTLETGTVPDTLRWTLYYLMGEHEALLEEYENHKGDRPDLLAIMAASVHLARQEPARALPVVEKIKDAEQRALRLKTLELWEALHRPLEAEPWVHVLILSYNRAYCVENSLRELGRSDYRNYRVFIADNGSTDGTAEIVSRAGEFFPESVEVHVQHFPTNIGRPAGHNWLLTGHDHSEADFIAIGDDDLVKVPPEWLTRMVQTAKTFPGCACVGGKSLTPGWPLRIHGSVRNLVEFGPYAVKLSNDGEHDDLGQHDFVDIVDHVIGCLHIFDRAALFETGIFDIRFSPCQFVDIEHHLRMRLAGKNIIYNGLIAFEHLRAMGVAAGTDPALAGNSMGNNLKLLHLYKPELVVEKMNAAHERRNAWLGL